MKHSMIATAAAMALALVAGSAWARHCPMDMKKIDEALAKKPQLSSAQMDEVKKLRADGERLHKEGKHPESEESLAKAMKILNVQ